MQVGLKLVATVLLASHNGLFLPRSENFSVSESGISTSLTFNFADPDF